MVGRRIIEGRESWDCVGVERSSSWDWKSCICDVWSLRGSLVEDECRR